MDLTKKYLSLLAKEYPTIGDTTTEIINLEAIMNLPKGTEHFVSDVHGEYESFQHVLRNGSGNIKEKILFFFFIWINVNHTMFDIIVTTFDIIM